tara:strand:+ start:873 stop:1607 length:735 start_codon:yes stop_codon:yes gene_type:complete
MAKILHIADAIDENLKLVRDADGTNAPLQLSKDKMKVVGDLDVTGSTSIRGSVTSIKGSLEVVGKISPLNSIRMDGRVIYFDGGEHTYIHESIDDNIEIVVGGDAIMALREAGNGGNIVNFLTSSAGFTQHEPTYNASDTEVYFSKLGNKAFFTFGAGNVTDLNLYFPNVSCNCTLLVKQDGTGSRTITNYKSFDSGAGNESTVKWAGGSAPTLSTGANAVDIISFYWDNDNYTAYGVASLNFS